LKNQHILDEIRRTAAENGGVALGVRGFAKATGIQQHDWRGVFWARWSDAVKEAGFAPNAYQAAYSDEYLFEGLVTLCRELGRFPTSTEIRLKARNDKTFANDRTYFSRFKSKQQMAASLLAYCNQRHIHEDVTRLCEAVIPMQKDHDEDAADVPKTGFVYLMKSGKHYKIGHSNSAGRREYELAIQLPEKLTTVHTIRTDDPPGIETYWHNRFAAKRLRGEWFDLTRDEVQAFKRRTFM
jgi:hypothetical protein